MNISENGIKFLSDREGGIYKKAYLDNAKPPIWTIGIGHTGLVDGQKINAKMSITTEKAIELFKADLKNVIACVNKNVHVPITQNQFDALVSITFNIGIGGFMGSGFLKLINKHDYIGASESIISKDSQGKYHGWVFSGDMTHPNQGLINRRTAEKELFLKK